MRLFTYRRAGAVVVDGDHVLLVSMQPPGSRRWWLFPGGGIEEGETPAEAACRELFEETGLVAATCDEYLRAGIHGGEHDYFTITCASNAIGAVTGPELEYAADADFRAEWVPIEALPTIPVFPRCVAEHVGRDGGARPAAPRWVEDDRGSWHGVPGAERPPHVGESARAVIVSGGRIAAIERSLDGARWFTLPGGGMEDGESPEEAAVREVREEVGLDVVPRARLAVVVVTKDSRLSVQTYVWCDPVGGELAPGSGDEYTEARRLTRGTYRPVWLGVDALPADTRPAWLAERLASWIAEPSPARPERFNESHDE